MSIRPALVLASAALAAGCAPVFEAPPAGAPERAAATSTYSASLRVALRGPSLRARTRALVAFRRPDALRVELPGPGGARLVAVTRRGTLAAVFPGERAFFESGADAASLEALFGVALEPAEVMDVLTGTPPPRLRSYKAGWGGGLPNRVDATLPDGARLELRVEDAAAGVELADRAFDAPPHPGYRLVNAAEARALWSGR